MSFEQLFTDTDHRSRITGASCPVILVASASGGAGSTIATLTAAELAVAGANLVNVLAVDGVREKGSMSTFLRMNKGAPTMHSAILHQSSSRGVIPAEVVNSIRSPKVPAIGFDVSLAPSYISVSDAHVDNVTRIKIIETLRKSSNLILIDCGDPGYNYGRDSQLAFMGQLLQTGNAYLLLMLEPNLVSASAAENITALLNSEYNVPRDRVMTLANKIPPYLSLESKWPELKAQLARISFPLDPVSLDVEGIMQPTGQGKLPTGQTELSSSLARAMFRATGQPGFEPIADAGSEEARRAKAVVKQNGASVVRDVPEKKSRFGGLRR